MVMPNNDPFQLSDYCRRLIGKAATRIELPLISHRDGHCLSPRDWEDVFEAIRAWARDCEFEISSRKREGLHWMRDATIQIEYRTKTLNRALRFIRERARQAAKDREQEALANKVKSIKSFGLRPVDSDLDSKSGTR